MVSTVVQIASSGLNKDAPSLLQNLCGFVTNQTLGLTALAALTSATHQADGPNVIAGPKHS